MSGPQLSARVCRQINAALVKPYAAFLCQNGIRQVFGENSKVPRSHAILIILPQ